MVKKNLNIIQDLFQVEDLSAEDMLTHNAESLKDQTIIEFQ